MISNIRIPLRDKTIISPSIAAHAHIFFFLFEETWNILRVQELFFLLGIQ